jgi:hypothetical protein
LLNISAAISLSRPVDEIKELRKEANANRELRATLNAKGAAERIFRKALTTALESEIGLRGNVPFSPFFSASSSSC